jgi:glycine/D-amino acid oxidase-like deaminating enzyme
MTYWKQSSSSPKAQLSKPKDGGILIIGSGLAGTSAAFFLKNDFDQISIVDCGTENASYFRNAGHMLHGISESYAAAIEIYGAEKAKALFEFSKDFLLETYVTIEKLGLQVDLSKGNYLYLAASKQEEELLSKSVDLQKQDGFDYVKLISAQQVEEQFNIKTQFNAKVCSLSSQANPAKFRDQLLENVLKDERCSYYSYKIKNIESDFDKVIVTYEDDSQSFHDCLVICANSYSPLFSKFFQERKLIEPFKGQIIVTSPLPQNWFPRMQWSADHGYMYGTTTASGRLLVGGWRNNVPGGEIGTYDLEINSLTENGLKKYIEDHFNMPSDYSIEYSWAGIMGANKSGLPYIGQTSDPLVYACCSCNGYGFSWSHGAAKLLSKMITGNDLPQGWQYFNMRD